MLQVLGAKRKILSGFSTANAALHQGFIYSSEIIQSCPEDFRSKAARVVGAKCTLLARIDAYGSDPSGSQGATMKVRLPLLFQLSSVKDMLPSYVQMRHWPMRKRSILKSKSIC